jgi:hypothetical protein
MKNVYKISVGKTEGKKSLGRRERRLEYDKNGKVKVKVKVRVGVMVTVKVKVRASNRYQGLFPGG